MEVREPVTQGLIEQILVSPVAAQLPRPVERARVVAGRGIEGDRYFERSGTWSDWPDQTGIALTLVEVEVLESLGLDGAAARRNVVTRGVRLNDLVGRDFRLGELRCRGIRLAEPCQHLEQLTGVAMRELVHRGGLRADVLADGEIVVGDPIVA